MPIQLNQIIAIQKGVISQAERGLTSIYHKLQKGGLLSGISRTYQPLDELGEQLPPESTRVQLNVEDALKEVAGLLTRLFDVTATKDYANCSAFGNVVVDGVTILEDVPVTYLLFLEKQLVNLHTLVVKLPTLDPSSAWSYDLTSASWRADQVRTTRTKKVPRNHVKAEATDKHPAQVEVYHEDVVVGYWTKVDFSGAMPQDRVNEIAARVEKLQEAVKFGREQANGREVTDQSIGSVVFGYLFQ